MHFSITNRQRAGIVGGLVLLAYSMLTYTITQNKPLGVATDILSGLAVIGIPVLLYPLFNGRGNKGLNLIYFAARFIEGMLMIVGGIFILSLRLEPYRNDIYEFVHIYFFIAGAVLFNMLLYRTLLVPRFISLWGGIGALGLGVHTVLNLFGINEPILGVLILPMVLNELFLAIWLIIKGFNPLVVSSKN